MAKLINALLVTIALGNGFTINGMEKQQPGITVIVSPKMGNTNILSSFVLKPYNVLYTHLSNEDDMTSKIANIISDAKSEYHNHKIVLYAVKEDVQILLQHVAKDPTHINAIILNNPTYNPNYLIGNLDKRIPQNIAVIINPTEPRFWEDAKLFYAILGSGNRCKDNLTTDHKTYYMNINEIKNVDIEKLLDDTENIRSYQRSYQHTIDKETEDRVAVLRSKEKETADKVAVLRSEENKRYYQYLALKLFLAGAILYSLYKINAFNAILDHIKTLRQ